MDDGSTKRKRRALTEFERMASLRLKNEWNARKKELGLTQESAAALMGFTTQGALGHYLNGYAALNLQALVRICGVIGANPVDVYPEIVEPVMGVMAVTESEFERVFSSLGDNDREYVFSLMKRLSGA